MNAIKVLGLPKFKSRMKECVFVYVELSSKTDMIKVAAETFWRRS